MHAHFTCYMGLAHGHTSVHLSYRLHWLQHTGFHHTLAHESHFYCTHTHGDSWHSAHTRWTAHRVTHWSMSAQYTHHTCHVCTLCTASGAYSCTTCLHTYIYSHCIHTYTTRFWHTHARTHARTLARTHTHTHTHTHTERKRQSERGVSWSLLFRPDMTTQRADYLWTIAIKSLSSHHFQSLPDWEAPTEQAPHQAESSAGRTEPAPSCSSRKELSSQACAIALTLPSGLRHTHTQNTGTRTWTRISFGSPFTSKVVVCGHWLVTLSLTN